MTDSHYHPPAADKLDILYQDDHLLAINKPAGLLSVPGRGEDKQDCMIGRVQQEFPSALAVHRLDMATSGIMLIALDTQTHRLLSQCFEARLVDKTYVAMVNGLVEADQGEIDAPMRCDWPNRPRQMIDHDNGKAAHTLYNVLARDPANNVSRLELRPLTGRSHQLRVHMQAIGHPIIGDALYNTVENNAGQSRMLLHAQRLVFTHPYTTEVIDIRCEPDF